MTDMCASRAVNRRPCRRTRRRRIALAFTAVVVGVLACTTGPALAHDSEELPATNYASAVISLDPPPDGVTARIIEAGNRLELTNRNAQEIVVLGYEGEPMLRVGRAGVFENRRSPSVFTSATRPLAIPPDASPTAEPRWSRISAGAVARWHDHRVDPGPAAKRDTASWTIPLRQEERAITLTGSQRYVPGPNPLPWLGAATVLLAGVAGTAVLRPRRWRPVMATALTVAVVLDVVHGVGRLTASYGPLPNRLFDLFFPLLGWMAAVVALRSLARRPDELPSLAGLAGLALFLISGLGRAAALSNSQLAFSFSPTLARLAVVAALGVGGGVLVALVSSLFGPLPAGEVAVARESEGPPEPGRGDEHAISSHRDTTGGS